ncbi:hypothetical protein FRC10_008577 [Ceratobasidium sp. 414]|nr:hypothetical protein FRC10_008577 [Ceratobasidium sp. 414]
MLPSRPSSEHTRHDSPVDSPDVEKQAYVADASTHPAAGKGDEAWEVKLDENDDPKNRRASQKWLIVFVLATSSTCVTCASSVAAMARPGLQKEFGVSLPVAILGISLFVEGLGVGPLLLGPLSEFFGRRHIYWISFVWFVLLNFLVAFAPNIGFSGGK